MAKTQIIVDDDVWAKFRSKALIEKKKVNELMNEVLKNATS